MTLESEENTPPRSGRKPKVAAPPVPAGNSTVDLQLQGIGEKPGPMDEDAAAAAAAEEAAAVAADAAAAAAADAEAAAAAAALDAAANLNAEGKQPPADSSVLNPFMRGQMPAPKESKAAQRDVRRDERTAINQPTPSTKKLGVLGKKLPGAEHIRIHKRVEDGELAYIGEYNNTDLAQSQNIESFINRYIKTKFGAGEYQITGVDAQGREFDAGIVKLLQPLSTSSDLNPVQNVGLANPLDFVQKVYERDADRRDREMGNMMTQQKDPVRMLKEVLEIQAQLTPQMPAFKPSEGGGGTTNTMLSGMMQMMTSVLAVAMQPKPPDPLMVALISKLIEKSEPAPALNPTAQLVQLSEVLRNLQGGNSGGSQLVEYLTKDRMSPTDVLKLVNEVKGERGTDDLKKSLENVGFLMNAVTQLRGVTEPSTASGFWDAINALFSNPNIADAIGARARGQAQPPAAAAMRALPIPATLAQQPPQQRDPLAIKAREILARKMRLDELELAERERRLGIGVPAAAAKPSPVPPPQAAAVAQVPAAPALPNVASIEQSLPPDIAAYINAYLQAKDDGDILKTTIDLVFGMAKDVRWKPYSEVIVALIVKGDRAKFLHYMSSLFVSLRSIKLIEDELARKVMDTLARNFDGMVETVKLHLDPNAALNPAELESPEDAEGESEEGDGEGEDGEEGEEDDGSDPEDLLQLE